MSEKHALPWVSTCPLSNWWIFPSPISHFYLHISLDKLKNSGPDKTRWIFPIFPSDRVLGIRGVENSLKQISHMYFSFIISYSRYLVKIWEKAAYKPYVLGYSALCRHRQLPHTFFLHLFMCFNLSLHFKARRVMHNDLNMMRWNSELYAHFPQWSQMDW